MTHHVTDTEERQAEKRSNKLFLLQLLLSAAGQIFSTALKAKLVKEKVATLLVLSLVAGFLIFTTWLFLMLAAAFGLIYLGVGVIGALLLVTLFNLICALVFVMLARRERKKLTLGEAWGHLKKMILEKMH